MTHLKTLLLLIGWFTATLVAVCPAQSPSDTAPRPPIPRELNLPADSTFTLEVPPYPRSELLYFSNIIGVSFSDVASGASIRRVLAAFGLTIIGGYQGAAGPSEYIVRLTTPAPSLAALDSLLKSIALWPGVDRATKVNYRTPISVHGTQPSDTTRPPMPTQLNLPGDSTMTVPSPPGRQPQLYYRHVVGIAFHDTTRGATIRRVLREYEATVIGGAPYLGKAGVYIVMVPDRVRTFAGLDSLKTRIAAEPGVDYVMGLTYRGTYRLH